MGRLPILLVAALLGTVNLNASQYVNPVGNKYYNPYMSYNSQPAYNPYTQYAAGGAYPYGQYAQQYGQYPYGQQYGQQYGQYGQYGQYNAVPSPNYRPAVSYVAGNVLVANAGSVAGQPAVPSYVYSNNNLAGASLGKVVIVSDYDPLAGKSLDEAVFGGKAPAVKKSGRRRRRRQLTSTPSCEFKSNSKLNSVVTANSLSSHDALVLIASPMSTPISVTRILANRATLLVLGQRTNLYLATVPAQKARTPAQLADVEAANTAIRALDAAEADVHLLDYAAKVTDVVRQGTSLTPTAMCAWVRQQVASTMTVNLASGTNTGVPAPVPVAPAPVPVAPAPVPVPVPSPVAPAPVPVVPAPVPVAPAPVPVAPAPVPVVPAPVPVVPAPVPVVPAPVPVVPAPVPVVPAVTTTTPKTTTTVKTTTTAAPAPPPSGTATGSGTGGGPAPTGSGTGGGPAPTGTGPAPTGTGPAPTGTGPAPTGTGPAPTGTGPAPTGSGPAPTGSGPAPTGSGSGTGSGTG